VDRHFTALKHGGFALIDIDTEHIIARVRQTGARNQAHVT
jgi:hypothetical protein